MIALTLHARWSMFVAAVLCASASCRAVADDFTYVKGSDRASSRQATLAQYLPELTLGDWYVVGPFDNVGMDKYDIVYAPERTMNAFDPNATFTGRYDQTVRWERIADDGWAHIELRRFGNDDLNSNGVAYLYREFDAAQAGTITFNAGSDDGLKLWVNGNVIIDADVYRGFNIADHHVRIPVVKGRNTIFAKVTNGASGWEFEMQPVVSPRILAQLEYHLNRDFPASRELEYYQLLTVLEPDEVVLEVGGITLMPDGRPIVTTRRGDAWIVDGAYEDPPFGATYTRFASGMHEALGAWWHDGGLLVTQRGEVTKLVDTNGDDVADRYLSYCDDWGVSGNYHEFAFGPEMDGAGRLWVTLNIGFCGGLGKSVVPWRGWALIVNDDGTTTPVAGGLRSPNGLGRNAAGEMFASDNQGDWVGTNKLMHLAPGDWHGHPSSFRWYDAAGFETPTPDDFKPPAVWFPYDRMGRSASDILLDDTGGRFGPFDGQLFVGDQFAASVMRVDLEDVNGTWQGACFPFLSGFDSGVNRLCWAPDGSLLVGMTNRGWWSHGPRGWGLQRVVWSGDTPCELKTMRATPDGFELTFTSPVDRAAATRASTYRMQRFRYHRWEKYGSPEIDHAPVAVTAVEVSDDATVVRLRCSNLAAGFVHELILDDLSDADGAPLLHTEAWYTLNVRPGA